MKNGYSKIFFSDPKSADLTQSKYKPSNNSEGHKAKKILGIFFSLVYHPGAMVRNWLLYIDLYI